MLPSKDLHPYLSRWVEKMFEKRRKCVSAFLNHITPSTYYSIHHFYSITVDAGSFDGWNQSTNLMPVLYKMSISVSVLWQNVQFKHVCVCLHRWTGAVPAASAASPQQWRGVRGIRTSRTALPAAVSLRHVCSYLQSAAHTSCRREAAPTVWWRLWVTNKKK